MSEKTIFFILIILGVLFEILGDIFFKKRSIENKNIILVIGFIVYCIGGIFRAISLKYEILSKAIVVFTILNLVIVVGVGIMFYGEWDSLSIFNRIGILLGIIGVFLMEI